jgi:nickel/cobalt exporter
MEYLMMLASAFGLGATHALEPGHGKTVVAAYLVGSRGRTLDAIILGAVVTFTHTFSVLILTVVSTIAAAYIVPHRVERWLAIGSGLLVTMVGAWMIYARTRHGPPAHSHNHAHHSHNIPAHGRGHDCGHKHEERHDPGDARRRAHDHLHAPGEDDPRQPALGGGGCILVADGGEEYADAAPVQPAAAGDTVSTVGFGSLVALGVSGGIVPCPAALLLVPAAIGLGTVLKGLGLIMSFSLGLAVMLMAVGILTLRAAGFASGWLERGNWARRVSVASAYFIALLGLALTVKALLFPETH